MKKTELLMLAICVSAAVSCGSRSAADKKSSSPESDGHDAFSTTKAKKEYLNDSGKAEKKKIATTDLFRYGDPVRCPEDNIRNLFTNWSGSGAESNGIHLLTYNYEGTAKNVRQLEKYVGHNQSAGMPYWNYCCNYEENKLHLETVKGARKKPGMRKFASGALIAHFVSPGDHTFGISFPYNS